MFFKPKKIIVRKQAEKSLVWDANPDKLHGRVVFTTENENFKVLYDNGKGVIPCDKLPYETKLSKSSQVWSVDTFIGDIRIVVDNDNIEVRCGKDTMHGNVQITVACSLKVSQVEKFYQYAQTIQNDLSRRVDSSLGGHLRVKILNPIILYLQKCIEKYEKERGYLDASIKANIFDTIFNEQDSDGNKEVNKVVKNELDGTGIKIVKIQFVDIKTDSEKFNLLLEREIAEAKKNLADTERKNERAQSDHETAIRMNELNVVEKIKKIENMEDNKNV